ncbi:MAG: alanine racemase C-terminal domain-containing protein, partial [Pseudomonadota bacterium]
VGSVLRADARLACVARLTAPVIQIADLLPGERVGYGGEFRAERPTRAATLAIGYGDGLPRSAGSAASVRLRGATVPIIGRVSMDLTVIDATDVPDLKPGDLAEVFGPSAPIETFAADASAIAYEILTGLGGRVRRRYWKEGAQIAP